MSLTKATVTQQLALAPHSLLSSPPLLPFPGLLSTHWGRQKREGVHEAVIEVGLSPPRQRLNVTPHQRQLLRLCPAGPLRGRPPHGAEMSRPHDPEMSRCFSVLTDAFLICLLACAADVQALRLPEPRCRGSLLFGKGQNTMSSDPDRTMPPLQIFSLALMCGRRLLHS